MRQHGPDLAGIFCGGLNLAVGRLTRRDAALPANDAEEMRVAQEITRPSVSPGELGLRDFLAGLGCDLQQFGTKDAVWPYFPRPEREGGSIAPRAGRRAMRLM